MFLLITDGRQTRRARHDPRADRARCCSTSAPTPASTSTAAARRRSSRARSATRRDAAQHALRRPASAPIRPASACSSRPATARSHDSPSRPPTPRVFPGLHRTLTAVGLDDHRRAVAGATSRGAHRVRRRHRCTRRRRDGTLDVAPRGRRQAPRRSACCTRCACSSPAPPLASPTPTADRADAARHRPRRRGLHRPDRAAGHDARLRPRVITIEETAAGALKITPLAAAARRSTSRSATCARGCRSRSASSERRSTSSTTPTRRRAGTSTAPPRPTRRSATRRRRQPALDLQGPSATAASAPRRRLHRSRSRARRCAVT